MSTPRVVKVLNAQYNKSIRSKNQYIKFARDEEDLFMWYILIHNIDGDNDEFKGGEYLFSMKAPTDFPFKPPVFHALTPNGVYEINKAVCINIGHYHSENYRAALGMDGFANQLVSGIIGWQSLGKGINLRNTSIEVKKKLAKASVKYNQKHNAHIMQLINNAYDEYSKRWK